ncbi:hypothetical protein KI387_044550, partial [Taxus chinensis]
VTRSHCLHVVELDPPHTIWNIFQSLFKDPSHIVTTTIVSYSTSCEDNSIDTKSLISISNDEDFASSFDDKS